ncbi:MAG: ABC transporter ATP-binding protein [bacterium]
MEKYSIKVQNLTKKFGTFTAVDDISFNVKEGEILGFLGPNGAGKTTTIKVLCGLLIPTKGEVSVENYDIKKDVEKIKTIIGYMSQKFSLYTDLTVYENIKFYAGIYGVDGEEAKIKEIIEMLDIEEYKNTITAELPAGIRQRVALATAFIHTPKILFLDEPTAGVDPVLRRKFWAIIKKWAQQGTTILVTTHYMDEAENCNRIALINQGKLVDIGEIDEIKGKFIKGNILCVELSENYVKEFNTLKKIEMPVKDISLHGSIVHIIQDIDIEEAKKKIKDFCKTKEIKYKSIFEDNPSLEDIFINLIRKKN